MSGFLSFTLQLSGPLFIRPLLGWDAGDGWVRTTVLIVGVLTLFVGIFLMRRHQHEMIRAETGKLDEREFQSARRKFRRRMTSSLVISLIGVLLAALNWAVHPRVFAAIVLLTLCLLLVLFFMALYDMFHIGIEALADPHDEERKELVQEVLRRRDEIRKESSGDKGSG